MLLIKSFLLCEAKKFLISVYLVAEDSFHHFLIVTKKKKDVKPELQFSIMQNKTYRKDWRIALYT